MSYFHSQSPLAIETFYSDFHPATMLRVLLTTLLALLALLVMATVAAPVALGADAPLVVPPESDAAERPAAIEVQAAPADSKRTGSNSANDSADWVPLAVVPNPDEALFADSGSPLKHAPSICDEPHWILSIRHCEDCCPQCACRFDFDVRRADWNGCWQPSNMSEFQQSLIPGAPTCVMVHGSFVTPDTVAEDSRNTFHWLRQAAPHLPLNVVFVTWPSDGIFTFNPSIAATSLVPSLDVSILGRRAEMNGCRLARLVQSLPADSPICLLGHSHGARMVASACHFLGGGQVQGIWIANGPGHRVRAVFAGAAIDHDWLNPGQRYDRALCAAECVLNLKSRSDWALAIYPLRRPFSRLALGQTGFTSRDLRQLGSRAGQVADFDVSEQLGVNHIWPCFYERPEIAAALVPWIYFTE
ncbi:hypothetical protein GC176_13435 [bacterium]|nr:hypothetical protein [bacterium]